MISERLASLRKEMQREHLGAVIIPTTDAHQSEYVADYWKGREWISGFDGSAGTVVVTMDAAALWTDSRYFLAAEEQLRGTEIVLMKERVEGTPSIAEWVGEQLYKTDSTEVLIDGMCASYAEVENLKHQLRKANGCTLRTNLDILSRIWKDRPALPSGKIIVMPQPVLKDKEGRALTHETASERLSRIRHNLLLQHADAILVSALDSIAWILGLRGSDVHCTPVFVSYLLISQEDIILYVDKDKLTAEAQDVLATLGVDIKPYSAVKEVGRALHEPYIMLDPDETSYTLYNLISASGKNIRQASSPIPAMKAIKTAAEQEGFRRAMLYDGIALVKFLRWLDEAVPQGGQTEISIDEKLTQLRSEQPHFAGLSFDTIAAYQEHGAIVHYEASPETDATLCPEGLLLLDTGAHYMGYGTTDITRTIALGPLTEEQCRIYTLVLKAHIQMELTVFPSGACGSRIDAVARQPLWREGLNFGHGTGHGIGTCLSVHEGPHQVRQEWRPAPMVEGMLVTDEPGIYLAGKFGVRIENILLATKHCETDFGKFLGFESLTLCPIDLRPVITSMLTAEEVRWINDYHAKVKDAILPHLTDENDIEWLQHATKQIPYNV